MKSVICDGTFFVFLLVSGMTILMDNAIAQINMPERENIQTIVWAVEFVTFVTAMGIVWIIWRIGKRDSESRREKRDRS
ncbi:MAG: hypothetical protein WCA63_00955 [Gallionella sp.]